MLHPDYQYTPRLIGAMAWLVASGEFDVVLGSRILGTGALKGGMPLYKYLANRFLTVVENLLLGVKLSEFHTGYRAFSREILEALPLGECSDDFVFDNQILAQAMAFGYRIGEISCPTRYFPEASSINLTPLGGLRLRRPRHRPEVSPLALGPGPLPPVSSRRTPPRRPLRRSDTRHVDGMRNGPQRRQSRNPAPMTAPSPIASPPRPLSPWAVVEWLAVALLVAAGGGGLGDRHRRTIAVTTTTRSSVPIRSGSRRKGFGPIPAMFEVHPAVLRPADAPIGSSGDPCTDLRILRGFGSLGNLVFLAALVVLAASAHGSPRDRWAWLGVALRGVAPQVHRLPGRVPDRRLGLRAGGLEPRPVPRSARAARGGSRRLGCSRGSRRCCSAPSWRSCLRWSWGSS